MTRIGVVIPIGTWAPYVEESVASARAQTGVSVMTYLIDNSRERVPDWVRALVESDDVRLVGSVHSFNAAFARNLGNLIAVEEGVEFLAVLDSDDEYCAGHLDRAVGALQSQPNALLYSASYVNIFKGKQQDVISRPIDSIEQLILNCTIGHSTVVTRADGWVKYPEIGPRHDLARWVLTLKAGGLIVSDQGVVGARRFLRRNSFSRRSKLFLVRQQFRVAVEFGGLGRYRAAWLVSRFLILKLKRKVLCGY